MEARVSPLLDDLHSRDPRQRAAACRRAASDSGGALLAEKLVEALGDSERVVVRAASEALVSLERDGARLEPLLKRALRGAAPLRMGAALVLARLGTRDIALLPPLIEALASPARDVRWSAARAVVGLGQVHQEVLPVLLGLLAQDERASVRRMAALALGELAPAQPHSILALLGATQDADPGVRGAAVSALGGLPEPPGEVAARLCEVVASDQDLSVRRLGCAALAQVGDTLPGPSEAALRQALASAGEAGLQQAARHALEQWTRRRAPEAT
jgi:HEAT repeat protein